MAAEEFVAITGAFGFTGKYIAQLLLSQGYRVRTLTAHPNRPHAFCGRIGIAPLDFSNPQGLEKSLRGATTLYNTYWIRFPWKGRTYDQAVENTKNLLRAAARAGVNRIVHISITNPAEDSPLPYFRGKALVEAAILRTSPSYAIVRPSVIFGLEDILINNIAWFIRRFPIFAIPGDGQYRVQPVFVEDVAEIAVNAASQSGNVIIDAAGPEVLRFEELVRLVASAVGKQPTIIHLKPQWVLLLLRAAGALLRDIILTREEIEGLMANLLISADPPRGSTRLGDWLTRQKNNVGIKYASEIERHYR